MKKEMQTTSMIMSLNNPTGGLQDSNMQTAYVKGFYSGNGGDSYINPYDLLAEAEDFKLYLCGWRNGRSAGLCGG